MCVCLLTTTTSQTQKKFMVAHDNNLDGITGKLGILGIYQVTPTALALMYAGTMES